MPLSHQGKKFVAESKLKTAAIQVELAKKFAAEHQIDLQNSRIISKRAIVQSADKFDNKAFLLSNGGSTKRRTVAETPFTDENINDSYFAGRMLINS